MIHKPPFHELQSLCGKFTIKQIAERFDCDPTTIHRWKREYGLTQPTWKKGKLTKLQARKIRELYNTDEYTQKELGKMFGVSQGMIGRIINNKAHPDRSIGFGGRADVTVNYNF